jgi:hypothetical protein
VSPFVARRGFLRTALTLLTARVTPAPTAWAAQPNLMGAPDVGVTPNHAQELLVELSDIDGIHLRKVPEEGGPPPGGLVLGLFRYDPPGKMSSTVHRLVLPWVDVRAGLYVRSVVPYRIRMVLDPDDGELTTRILLGRRVSVAVYRETPLWVEGPPWQVVVLAGAPPAGRPDGCSTYRVTLRPTVRVRGSPSYDRSGHTGTFEHRRWARG